MGGGVAGGGEVMGKEREGEETQETRQEGGRGEERKEEGDEARERESWMDAEGQVFLAEHAASWLVRHQLNLLSPALEPGWGVERLN